MRKIAWCALWALACGGSKSPGGSHLDETGTPECEDRTTHAPVDTAMVQFFTASDGTNRAIGDLGGWWMQDGTDWRALSEVDRRAGPSAMVEDRLWVAASGGFEVGDGHTWRRIELDRRGVVILAVAASTLGEVVAVGIESCDDCEAVPTYLYVGGADGFTETALGYLSWLPMTLGIDDEGRVLAVASERAWEWSRGEWTEWSLPETESWTAVWGKGGTWVLASAEGRVLTGSDAGWSAVDLGGAGAVPLGLDGTSLSDVWMVGQRWNGVDEEGVVWHSDGEAWVEKYAGVEAAYAVQATGPQAARVALRGPKVAQASLAALGTSWIGRHWSANGEVARLPGGGVLLVDRDGVLTVGRNSEWADAGALGLARGVSVLAGKTSTGVVLAAETGTVAHWEEGQLTAWPTIEGEVSLQCIAAVADGTVFVGGFAFEDGGIEEEMPVGRLWMGQGDAWDEMSLPSGAGHINALLARTSNDLYAWDTAKVWHWDGVDWTAMDVPAWVMDFAETADGQIWAATEAGLYVLREGAWQPADGPNATIRRLIADGDRLLLMVRADIGMSLVVGTEGDWTTLATYDSLLDVETSGDGHAVLVVDGRIEEVCLP